MTNATVAVVVVEETVPGEIGGPIAGVVELHPIAGRAAARFDLVDHDARSSDAGSARIALQSIAAVGALRFERRSAGAVARGASSRLVAGVGRTASNRIRPNANAGGARIGLRASVVVAAGGAVNSDDARAHTGRTTAIDGARVTVFAARGGARGPDEAPVEGDIGAAPHVDVARQKGASRDDTRAEHQGPVGHERDCGHQSAGADGSRRARSARSRVRAGDLDSELRRSQGRARRRSNEGASCDAQAPPYPDLHRSQRFDPRSGAQAQAREFVRAGGKPQFTAGADGYARVAAGRGANIGARLDGEVRGSRAGRHRGWDGGERDERC